MMEYNRETREIRIVNRYLRCIAVVQREEYGKILTLAKHAPIGGYEITMKLEGKTSLHTPNGSIPVKIRETPGTSYWNRDLIRITKTTIQFGEIERGKDGLEALEAVLLAGEKHEFWHDVETFILRFARKHNLIPEADQSSVDEMNVLMARSDFEFDKDYTGIWNPEILKAV
nr:MAG TPA: hypothetical protein [Caudoviricetes sp.]